MSKSFLEKILDSYELKKLIMKTLITIASLLVLISFVSCNKTTNTVGLTNTKWKLVKLMGKDINESDAFISFESKNNTVFGNAGCNNFTGTYTLKEETHFELSPLATTRKMCTNMDVETLFLEILNNVDNYVINDNKLMFHKAKTAPLAVFELMN